MLPAASSAAFAIMAMRRVQPTTAPRVVAVGWPNTNPRRAWPVPAAVPNFRAAVLPQPHDAITPSRRCRWPGAPLPFTSQRGGGGSEGAPQAVHSPPPPGRFWGGEECGDGGRLQAGGIRASSGPVLHPLTATPTALPHAARHIRARRVLCAGGHWASVWGGRAREASERARSTAVAGWFTCQWGSHLRRLFKSRRLPRPCARCGRWTTGRLASIVVLIRLFLLSFAFLPLHLVRLFSPLPLVSPSLCPLTSPPLPFPSSSSPTFTVYAPPLYVGLHAPFPFCVSQSGGSACASRAISITGAGRV